MLGIFFRRSRSGVFEQNPWSSNVVQGPVAPSTLAGIRDRPLVRKCSVDANGFTVILTKYSEFTIL